MLAERWQEIERLYHSACELKPAERRAYLESACRGDEALRREVTVVEAPLGRFLRFVVQRLLQLLNTKTAGPRSKADQSQYFVEVDVRKPPGALSNPRLGTDIGPAL